MTLQAKLTLSTVLLATVIVAVISLVDLGNIMELEFETRLRQAEHVRDITVGDVKEALNGRPDLPVEQALEGDRLMERLKSAVTTYSKEIVEVAVVNEHNEILADSNPERLHQQYPPQPESGAPGSPDRLV